MTCKHQNQKLRLPQFVDPLVYKYGGEGTGYSKKEEDPQTLDKSVSIIWLAGLQIIEEYSRLDRSVCLFIKPSMALPLTVANKMTFQ